MNSAPLDLKTAMLERIRADAPRKDAQRRPGARMDAADTRLHRQHVRCGR